MVTDCLYCKAKTVQTSGVKDRENFIIYSQICTTCRRGWKDFKGVDNENSPILSLQRNTSNDNEDKQ